MHDVETMAIIFAPRGALAQVLPGDEGRAGQVALAQGMANALMKADTKAKRRVTLSIAGLGWLDETELATISPRDVGAPDTPVASVQDASLEDAGPAAGAARTTETPSAAAPSPAAGPARDAGADPKAAVLRSILARVRWLRNGHDG